MAEQPSPSTPLLSIPPLVIKVGAPPPLKFNPALAPKYHILASPCPKELIKVKRDRIRIRVASNVFLIFLRI